MSANETSTVCLEARLNLLELATMARFYRSQGVQKLTKSALLSAIVSDFAAVLVANGKVAPVSDAAEAAEELSALLQSTQELLKRTRQSLTQTVSLDQELPSMQVRGSSLPDSTMPSPPQGKLPDPANLSADQKKVLMEVLSIVNSKNNKEQKHE